MFIAELSVNDFIQYFEDLVRKAFTSHKMSVISVFSWIQKIFLSYLADNLYLLENLKTELKEIFDETMFMFDCFYTTAIEVKIVLSVITITDCSSCLFTNYQELRSENCNMSEVQMFSCHFLITADHCWFTEYHVIQFQNENSKSFVWQM